MIPIGSGMLTSSKRTFKNQNGLFQFHVILNEKFPIVIYQKIERCTNTITTLVFLCRNSFKHSNCKKCFLCYIVEQSKQKTVHSMEIIYFMVINITYFSPKLLMRPTLQQGPSQDPPFNLTHQYVSITIYFQQEQDQFAIKSSYSFFDLFFLFVLSIGDKYNYYKINIKYTSIFDFFTMSFIYNA